ncbi:aldo/keto reductase [Oricola sp.]|uniref:aldo/keto reductase n=1 Tax=Oricola sp. TaxID=1979950 RepID=UPI003BAC9A4F
MRNSQLGQGLTVHSIGLGCMGMSEFYGDADEARSLKVLDRALELGSNFWDTADMYGPFANEELLAKALKGRRDKVTLATKFGIVRLAGNERQIDGRPDYVKACCDASLKRLGVDDIDLYYQHRVDPATPIEETVGAMSELVKAGKVHHIGLSEADPATIERAHAVHPITALQTEYSLWTREIEAEILPTLRRLGIGFVAYSPLGRGFLTGAIGSRDDLQPGDWRLSNPRFSEDAMAANHALVADVQAIAAEKGVKPGQIALAWVLAQGDDIAAIPGTKRIAYLEQNVAAGEVQLSTEDIARLNAMSDIDISGTRY